MKRKLAIFLLIGIWALPLLSGAGHAAEDPLLEAGFLPPGETKTAPAFSLNSIEGVRIDLEYFRNRLVLLFFWTTW